MISEELKRLACGFTYAAAGRHNQAMMAPLARLRNLPWNRVLLLAAKTFDPGRNFP
jgi:hypothetical protein